MYKFVFIVVVLELHLAKLSVVAVLSMLRLPATFASGMTLCERLLQ